MSRQIISGFPKFLCSTSEKSTNSRKMLQLSKLFWKNSAINSAVIIRSLFIVNLIAKYFARSKNVLLSQIKERKVIHTNAVAAKLHKNWNREKIFLYESKRRMLCLRGWTRTERSKYLCTNRLLYTHDTFSYPLEISRQSEGNKIYFEIFFFLMF